MEKAYIEKLITTKSERIVFISHKEKSEAWKFFLKIQVDEKACDFVKCIDCSSVLKYVPGHGTGSMLAHLKACKNKGAKRQNTLTVMPGFVAAPTMRALTAADKSDLTDCLAYMCAKDIR